MPKMIMHSIAAFAALLFLLVLAQPQDAQAQRCCAKKGNPTECVPC